MAKVGRPSKYSQELADRICEKLACGQSMRTVCAGDDMPCMQTVFTWLRNNKEFLEQYTRAKEEAADAFIEEMLDISDDGTNDWMERNDPKNAGYDYNGEHVQRSRLRVDTRKWVASKLKPKKYGDKLDITSGDKPIPILGGIAKLPNDIPTDNSSTEDSPT